MSRRDGPARREWKVNGTCHSQTVAEADEVKENCGRAGIVVGLGIHWKLERVPLTPDVVGTRGYEVWSAGVMTDNN